MKPILFNTDMVRDILEGRKTVTRRVVKSDVRDDGIPWKFIRMDGPFAIMQKGGSVPFPIFRGRYQPGDILWVRETWNCGYIETSDAEYSNEAWFEEMTRPTSFSRFWYRADADDERAMAEVGGSWRPSIHMPREAARIFLRVTDVRVERLNEIDEAGAIAEGAFPFLTEKYGLRTAWEDFAIIWDQTVGLKDFDRYGWAANPWVWVISFERCEEVKEKANEND